MRAPPRGAFRRLRPRRAHVPGVRGRGRADVPQERPHVGGGYRRISLGFQRADVAAEERPEHGAALHRDLPRHQAGVLQGDRADTGRGRGAPAPRDVEHTGILKMRGLPFEATKENIIEWFADAAVQPPVALEADSVLICQNFSGRPSGVAFARFAGAEEAQAAAAMDRKMFGRRYVELFPAQPEDWEREVAKEQGNSGGSGGAPAAAAPAPPAEAD